MTIYGWSWCLEYHSDYGNRYGTQYLSVYESGNIKFLKGNVGKPEELLETMTRGRVYVLLNSKGNIKSITFFDKENKRSRVVEIDHGHQKMREHVHRGYERPIKDGQSYATKPTAKDREMIDRVKKLWESHKKTALVQ